MINRPDEPVRLERPSTSPRQEPDNGNSRRPERSQPTQPSAPRQETRTESVPAQESRTNSRPQRSDPIFSPRQEVPRTELPKENSLPTTESSGADQTKDFKSWVTIKTAIKQPLILIEGCFIITGLK
jgi:hypothetical protein